MGEPSPRFLVVGCGAIGGVVAAGLIELGHDVSILTTNPAIASALRARGLRVQGEGALPPVTCERVYERADDLAGPFDFVLLTTQPPQAEGAVQAALAPAGGGAQWVCFQNGLVEERIARRVGADRVIGAVVAWGASVVEPGIVDRTSSGGFVLGRLDRSRDPATEALGRALEALGPVTLTENLLGARWSKLAINCAISTLGTIGGDRLGGLMRHRFVRRLCLEIMTEAVETARAEGVALEKVSGTLDLDWLALDAADKRSAGSPTLMAKHGLLLAVGARYRRLRSSMLAAIERGRPPAVDFLNGEVVTRGERRGVDVRVNRAAHAEVWQIARRNQQPGLERLRALYDDTRCP